MLKTTGGVDTGLPVDLASPGRFPHAARVHAGRYLALSAVLGACGAPVESSEAPDAFSRRDAATTPLDAGPQARDAGSPNVDVGPVPPDADVGSPPAPAGDAGNETPQDAALAPSDRGEVSTADASPPPPETLRLSHPRELRGVWVATVYNINFPERARLEPEAQRQALTALLDDAVQSGLNAVFFQVRPEADAFWPSERSPWSRFLTGEQGLDPGWDPLGALVEEAHLRALEVHAWLNPYRAAVDAARPLHPDHVGARHPEFTYPYRGQLWLDPGAEVVRADAIAVVAEVVSRYRVDGLHFDDYFYPYPDDTDFPDDATFAAYRAGGGALARDDWRRENVNTLVREVSETVAGLDPDVRFGIAPFGIYRPGQPPGIAGLDQYTALYADPPRWMREGWVDYLAPQLYWNATRPQQDYETLLRWWTALAHDGRAVFAGNYLSQLGTEPAWNVDEFRRQVRISRAVAGDTPAGNIFFQIEPLRANTDGVRDVFATEFYPSPALTPPLAGRADVFVPAPTLRPMGGAVQVDHPDRAALRAFVLYVEREGGWVVSRCLPATTARLELLAPGRHALSAVARGGAESEAVVLPLP